MNQNIHIWVAPDGSRATMSITPADITRSEIDTEIAFLSIVNGICSDDIDAALQKMKDTGEPQHNITIAKADQIKHSLQFGNQQSEATAEKIQKIAYRARIAGTVLEEMASGKIVQDNGINTIFVQKDQKFCTISIMEAGKDIFGRPIHTTPPSGLQFAIDGTVAQNRVENRLEYTARKDGYLITLSTGKLSIIDPFSTDTDKMRLTFHCLPVWWDTDALVNTLLRISVQKVHPDIKYVSVSKNDLKTIIASEKPASIVLRYGKEPVRAQDSILTMLVKNDLKPHERNDGSMDYKEQSRFQYIKEGTVLAEKIKSVPGVPGVNVIGERINIDPPVDRVLEAGKNISQKEVNGKIIYTASSDGILNLKDHFFEILDILKIAADIGPQIGNIHSEKDVIVNGNVLGGFTVECHGTLVIDGSIENGATIIGDRNALIRQGVFGEKTKVFIKGDAEIGFIQDSIVHVEGNLHVKKFIYNSRVYCGGKLTVDGSGLDSSAKGCVMGGVVTAMQNMVLMSAGCEGENTTLFCGVNPEIETKVHSLKEKATVLNKKAASIRSSIHFDLSAPDIKERLQNLSSIEKEKVKKLLLVLKVLSQEQMTVADELAPIEKTGMSSTPELCTIEIKATVFPITIIKIFNQSKAINLITGKCIFKYSQKGGILIEV